MEYLGLVGFAVVVLGGAYTITRLMSKGGRNDESRHGGGAEKASVYD
jgi:hypothetical protein